MNKPYGENRKAALKSFDKKSAKTLKDAKPDHSNEEVKNSLKIGQTTKDGFTIKELLDDGRALLTSQSGTKFIKQKDIEIT
jgi:hypothetical protein